MDNSSHSIIKERLKQLQENTYEPEASMDALMKIHELLMNAPEGAKTLALVGEIQEAWRHDLLESIQCIDKLHTTVVQYEEELSMMMSQMDALVKCSVLIKQYSLYLKEEIESVSDKLDRKGLDERIDELVELLEEVKPKTHLRVVREADVLDFPEKPSGSS